MQPMSTDQCYVILIHLKPFETAVSITVTHKDNRSLKHPLLLRKQQCFSLVTDIQANDVVARYNTMCACIVSFYRSHNLLMICTAKTFNPIQYRAMTK